MKNLSIFAIAAGAAADMVGTLLTSVFITAIAGGMLLSQGVPEDEIGVRLAADTRVLLWSVALGLAASLIGGLVAARVAKQREVTHGATAGGVGLVLATISALVTPVVLPTWYVVLGYGLVVPVAALGGVLGGIWNRRGTASGR